MIRIHPLADVQSTQIGEGTVVWQFSVVLPNAVIGKNCNINCYVFIENDVVVGDNVTVKSGVQLWDGIRVGDNVFIGPNATFTNDPLPHSKVYPKSFLRTVIGEGSSIGANATILPGKNIGSFSFIGAGSVITKDVPPFTVWYGNPAKHKGYITKEGILIGIDMKDENGNKYIFQNGILLSNDKIS
ncbi:MAG: acyltransferase [Bacteroidetes bacterium]|nr:acyltransferase [Bacteroidota bacterium]